MASATSSSNPWFSQKDYGWGWSLPRNRKGLLATLLFAYAALPSPSVIPKHLSVYHRLFKPLFESLAARPFVKRLTDAAVPESAEAARSLYLISLACAFVALAALTSERPHWRWAGRPLALWGQGGREVSEDKRK